MKYKLTEKAPTIEAMSFNATEQEIEEFLYPHRIKRDRDGEPYIELVENPYLTDWNVYSPHVEFYLSEATHADSTFLVKYSDGRLYVMTDTELDNCFVKKSC